MGYVDFIIRILLSLFLGLSIGLERQLTGHTAGLRINTLICVGSCFFTLFPMIYGSDQVFRVGASIIAGVGFLCSGVIFKENGIVKGINTAATLWCTAAIGVLASSESYLYSVIATAILIASNLILRPLAKKVPLLLQSEENEKKYRISIICEDQAEWEIRQLLINTKFKKTLYLTNLKSGDVIGDRVEVVADFASSGKSKEHFIENLVDRILEHTKVVSAGWEVI